VTSGGAGPQVVVSVEVEEDIVVCQRSRGVRSSIHRREVGR